MSVTEIKTAIAKLPTRQRRALAAWVQQQAGPKTPALREHSRVRLLHAIASERLKAGALGSVVHLYAKGKACEVEFPRKDGSSAVVTLEAGQIAALPDS